MKTIRIHKIGTGADKIFFAISLTCLVVSMYGMGFVESYKDQPYGFIYPLCLTITHVVFLAHLLRIYLFVDSVYWNKAQAFLKLGNKISKVINFRDLKEAYIRNDELVIEQIDSDQLIFDVSRYQKEELDKLISLLQNNTVKMYANRHWVHG